MEGSSVIYHRVIRPYFLKHESAIDDVVRSAVVHVYITCFFNLCYGQLFVYPYLFTSFKKSQLFVYPHLFTHFRKGAAQVSKMTDAAVEKAKDYAAEQQLNKSE